jgi:thymidine kinase
MSQGRIELVIGPMFAGKSGELIKTVNRYKIINKKILIVNHSINNRYGTNFISTHDKKILEDCIIVDKLSSLSENKSYLESEIIVIEELQFFEDAFDFIINAADNDHKTIIGVGLSGDFNREPFGDILKLIPHAEKITKLSAFCKECNDGTKAHFSKLVKSNDKNQVQVGSIEKYEAVCRKHYLE